MNSLLESALKYAAIGWHIFPLKPGSKKPITLHGVKDATNDAEKIKLWWERWPDANIGLACGEKSGVYVIDVDFNAEKGIDGYKSLKEFPELPETVKQLTPRGGFHGFFSAKTTPTNRNSFRPGIDIRGDGYYVVLAPSAHPNGGIYHWCDGAEPGQHELAEFPEFMRPQVRVPWSIPVSTDAEIPLQAVPASSDIIPLAIEAPEITHSKPTVHTFYSDATQRASLYLSQCDIAVQGQAGHDKLLWAAVAMVQGFKLSDSQAYDLLAREYNPNCVPPWNLADPKDEKDFRRKISEARKLQPQHAPGWLLNNSAYAPVDISGIDVKNLLGDVCNEPIITTVNRDYSVGATPTGNSELSFLCRPTGLLGEICSWINTTALKSQPFLSLACALAFLGVLFGRKLKDGLGSRTNLYCMGIAPSSAGKAHAMNQIRRLAEAAGCSDLLGGADIASDSAIEDRVSRHPATLFLWDEIGHLFCHIKSGVSRHHAKVVSLLMQLYSASGNVYLGREYAENERQRNIIQPCCGIYGTSTPERFCAGISPEELQDGWLSRCLAFCSGLDPEKNRDVQERPVPQNLIDQVSQWYQREYRKEIDGKIISQFVTPSGNPAPPEQFLVPVDSEGVKIFLDFDNETRKYGQQFPLFKTLWAKGEENARRVALIVAGGNNFELPHIVGRDADYACRLIKYLLNDFGNIIAPEIIASATEGSKRKLITTINRAGIDGIRQGVLSKASQWADRRQRSNLIDDLVEAEEIIRVPVTENCHPTFRYWTANNYQKFLEKGK